MINLIVTAGDGEELAVRLRRRELKKIQLLLEEYRKDLKFEGPSVESAGPDREHYQKEVELVLSLQRKLKLIGKASELVKQEKKTEKLRAKAGKMFEEEEAKNDEPRALIHRLTE